MTRVQILEDQKAIFVAQKGELENKRSDIYVREQQAISNALLPFFEGFSPEAYIEVTRGSVYFKMDHPDYTYKKELFNLYLRERYSNEGVRFEGVDLSYYTTSTKGVDSWELKRLRMLGDLAEIVLKSQHDIIDAANNTINKFKEEYKEVDKQMQVIRSIIEELSNKISEVKKQKITFDLLNGGVEFSKGVEITLKFNYTVRIKSIKLIDISKSGKTATVVFEFLHHNQTSREENINVTKIIDQVLCYKDSIVQPILAE
jgi:hypothetical protein